MSTFVVVGVSSGIGLALCEHFLSHGNRVIGIGRKSSIQNENYSFLALDLSHELAVEKFSFPALDERFIFIYNSGVLGEVLPIKGQSEHNAKIVFQLNYLAAVALTKKVLNQNFCEQIIYISSGAAKRAITSWAQYCASKAALDMFAETLQLELIQESSSILVRSIAPGVVDTPMQAQIRATASTDFASVGNFIALHQNQELSSPKDVARKIHQVIEHPELYENVCLSVKEVS